MSKRTALITGASGGIGYELAKLFAHEGHDLVLVARNADKLKEIAEDFQSRYKITVHIVPMNLANPESVNELYYYLQRNHLRVDYLVNNAGFGSHGAFHELSLAETLEMVQLNITTLTHLSHLFLKDMIARKFGGILNIGSTASFQPGPFMAVYYASKAYVLSLSEALATEAKGTGVHVSALCPGPTKTGFQERAGVQKTHLVKRTGLMMSVERVAKIGYHGFMKGKAVIVPGIGNKALMQGVRITPRKITRDIVKFLHESR